MDDTSDTMGGWRVYQWNFIGLVVLIEKNIRSYGKFSRFEMGNSIKILFS